MSKLTEYIKNRWSLGIIALILVLSLWHRQQTEIYRQKPGLLQFDMAGYYAYLQAAFIYDDWTFSFYPHRYVGTWRYHYFLVELEDNMGRKVHVNKYNMGIAILVSPFFAIGDFESYVRGVPRDGFAFTYQYWMITATVFYIFLGLLLLRSILLQYYEDKIVAPVLLIMAMGTNLWHYTVYDSLMTHAFSFFLFCLAIFCSLKWLKTGKLRHLVALALVCGMIALVRLPNMIFFLVPVFWGVNTLDKLKERLGFFWQHKWQVLVGLGVFLVPFVPQVWYWYQMTGKFFVNVYASNGEHFYWTQPMIAEILIGYRTGWFIYTPVALFGIVGFYYLYRQHKNIMLVLLLYLCINIYVVASWSTWWYGGHFGMRALIESLVVLAFPMAALFKHIDTQKNKKSLVYLVAILLIGLNQLQSYQFKYRIIHYDSMSRKSYWLVFCKLPPLDKKTKEESDKWLIGTTSEQARRKEYKQTIW